MSHNWIDKFLHASDIFSNKEKIIIIKTKSQLFMIIKCRQSNFKVQYDRRTPMGMCFFYFYLVR